MIRRLILSLLFVGTTVAWCADVPPGKSGLENGDFLAVTGDSITEQKLYSLYIENYMLMCQPRRDLRVMQFGWNGETSWGFFRKMRSEAMKFAPSVVTITFGMNDGMYCAAPAPLDKYRAHLKAIVQNWKKHGVRFIVLASPGVVDSQCFWGGPDVAARYNPILAQERDIAREVAAEENVTFANMHDPMMDVMTRGKAKYGKGWGLAGQDDGVHPDENGHMVMAYVMLKALGCDGNIGTITLDLASNNAMASEGHTVLSSSGGTIMLESKRYPFCFFGEPSSPRSTRGVLEFIPFNEELNRFKLVVKGHDQGKIRVTWGNQSKVFKGAQLAQGINLAAEFLDNPFCEQFQKVQELIRSQQNFETPLIKRVFHELADLEQYVPEERESIEKVRAAGMKKARDLFDIAATSVQPVRHSITVEVVK